MFTYCNRDTLERRQAGLHFVVSTLSEIQTSETSRVSVFAGDASLPPPPHPQSVTLDKTALIELEFGILCKKEQS